MSKPHHATKYAIYAAVASVVGGVIGYGIGYFAFDWIKDLIISWGMQAHFEQAMEWFKTWGVWIVFLAGFSPIPYKVFTICAGVDANGIFPICNYCCNFSFRSLLLVAKLSAWGGEKYAD